MEFFFSFCIYFFCISWVLEIKKPPKVEGDLRDVEDAIPYKYHIGFFDIPPLNDKTDTRHYPKHRRGVSRCARYWILRCFSSE